MQNSKRSSDLFEETFHHDQFTGRSGTFFAYEGLGSIYWHMVSKLLLAAQETALRFKDEAEGPALARAIPGYPRRPGVQEDPGGIRRLPDRSVFAHTQRAGCQAAGHDRHGQGDHPGPPGRTGIDRGEWPAGIRSAGCSTRRNCSPPPRSSPIWMWMGRSQQIELTGRQPGLHHLPDAGGA